MLEHDLSIQRDSDDVVRAGVFTVLILFGSVGCLAVIAALVAVFVAPEAEIAITIGNPIAVKATTADASKQVPMPTACVAVPWTPPDAATTSASPTAVTPVVAAVPRAGVSSRSGRSVASRPPVATTPTRRAEQFAEAQASLCTCGVADRTALAVVFDPNGTVSRVGGVTLAQAPCARRALASHMRSAPARNERVTAFVVRCPSSQGAQL